MRSDWFRHSRSMGIRRYLLERTEQGIHHWQDLSGRYIKILSISSSKILVIR